MIKAKHLVPAGGSLQLNAGDTSAPSQVCFLGMSPSCVKAVLFILRVMALPPVTESPAAPLHPSDARSMQQGMMNLVFMVSLPVDPWMSDCLEPCSDR